MSHFFHKATLLQHKNGVYVFPAIHHHLKPVVMTTMLLKQFNAPDSMRHGVLKSFNHRFELYDVNVSAQEDQSILITATIKEPGRADVEFSETYWNCLIFQNAEL